MRNQLSLLAAVGAIAFGGQSIQLSTQTVSNTSIPAQTPGNPWRIEFSIQNWSASVPSGHPMDGTAVGADVQFLSLGGGDIRLQVYSRAATGQGFCQITGLGPGGPNGGSSLYANLFVTIRFQEDPVAMIDTCQAWDINGNLVFNQSFPYTANSGSNSAGATVGSLGSLANILSIAYFRMYTCTVPTNGRPPVTADTLSCALVFWSFDGNLSDASGNNYTGHISSGSPVFVPTPGQNLVVAVLQTVYAPGWTNTVSFRAGVPSLLNGGASYSQADGSAAVQCFWQLLAGPSALSWSANNSCTPTLTGLIFGDYTFQLVATDVNGNQATATQDIGAVATDMNGVVVNANPLVDALLGPMIAWGQNPWGFQDYWAYRATSLRNADYANPVSTQGLTYPGWSTNGQPQWETAGTGTVSYYWNCVGPYAVCYASQNLGATVNQSGGISAAATNFTVSSCSGLDFSSTPTRIIVYDGTNNDELRAISCSGTTLALAYDPAVLPRHSFANGTAILQSKVTGAGTHFLTDSNSSICPVGAPGLPGLSSYSTGTVALTAGSATMTGSGTSWNTVAGVVTGDFVQVVATNDAGAMFTFIAQISAINSATGITLARPFPSDAATASGLVYNIMPASRTVVLHYQNQYTDPIYDPVGDSLQMWGTTGCESETAAYLNPTSFGVGNSFSGYHDTPLDGQHLTGLQYSVTDTTGWINGSSTGGINFYGEDLAHWALYYRSGLNVAKTAAQSISNYWLHSPWASGFPILFLGGGGVGAWVSYLTDPNTKVSISNLRSFGSSGAYMVTQFGTYGCNAYDDTRDSGWAYLWLVLAAAYDPDTTSTAAPGGIPWRTYWQNQLPQMQLNDTACQRSDHSWSNGFIFNTNQTPVLTLTNNSTAVTATGAGMISPSVCGGVHSGTGSVVSGSSAFTLLTGTLDLSASSPTTYMIAITGRLGGSPFTGEYLYYYSGSGPVTLAVLWPGDTGSVTWMNQPLTYTNVTYLTSIGTSTNDLADLANNFVCIWNSATSLTLDHPWPGAGGSSYYLYVGNLAGYGQDTFMVGIKTLEMSYLAKQTLPALAAYVAPYQTFTNNAATWINTTGYDPNTKGINYGRVFQFCEPATTAVPGFENRTPGCNYGLNSDAQVAAREIFAEAMTAATLFYDYNQSPANKAWVDTVYGALWGSTQYNTGGVYQDANSVANNLGLSNMTDAFINAGKWTGFFAGAGMSHRWPADRLGGVLAAVQRRVEISFTAGAIANATAEQIVVTAPSGTQTTFPCSGSPCAVTVDDRQGTHLYQIQYLSAGGRVLSQTDKALLH
jgi:hypothetical protein